MKSINFKNAYLALFPLSLLAVRIAGYLGMDPLKLAQLSPLGCPIKRIFGINCPTCGLTRSVLYAWRGDYSHSWYYHFGGVGLLLLGIAFYFVLLSNREHLVSECIKQCRRNPVGKVFLVTTIFLYSFWGFFLRNSI